MANIFKGKNILVTGGTGSIGSEIVRKVLQYEPSVVRVLSNDENGLFNLEQELQSYPNTRFLLGDVRDKERLVMAVEGIDFIFHAAALKHVRLCEYNPFEAVKVNVLGTENVIEVAREAEVEKLITISTDKAVDPINVMGATKLLCERLTISANYYKGWRKTVFSCVRFGNVLDSRGSVMRLFREQIRNGGPITITDPDMTRFVMSLPKAADLVLKATEKARGGEIFILKMPTLRITDLGQVMIERLASRYGYKPDEIKIETTGKGTGEKIHEVLMTEDEILRAEETEEMYIVQPDLSAQGLASGKRTRVKKPESMIPKLLTKEEVRALMTEILI